MSYRIYLHYKKDGYVKIDKDDDDYDVLHKKYHNIEIWDETPIEQFKKIKGEENEEYPSYRVTKKDLLKIIKFYQFRLMDIAKERMRNKEHKDTLFWNCLYHSFKECYETNILICNSSTFYMQYFFLVDLYKNMKPYSKMKITHG